MSVCTKRAAILAVLLVVLLAALLWPDNGPRYKGRSLSSWLTLYEDAQQNSEDALPARDALQHIGTNALAYALRWMQETTTDFWAGDDEEPRGRGDRAVWVFDVLGPAGVPAIPQLKDMASANSVGSARALNSLVCIGPPALPALVGIITNRNAAIRYWAMLRLEDLGTNAAPAVPVLISCLGDSDKQIAYGALDTVIRLKPKWSLISSALTNQLENPDVGMRLRAIKAIADQGIIAAPAVPALTRHLHDEHTRVRYLTAKVLNQIAPDVLTNAPAQ